MIAESQSLKSHGQLEILIELRYWMVLILVFSLLSMFYVGLVLCFHFMYCAKHNFAFFPGSASTRSSHSTPNGSGY